MLTWVQALFLFRFLNKILAEKAKRKESLIQNVFETSTAAASTQYTVQNKIKGTEGLIFIGCMLSN